MKEYMAGDFFRDFSADFPSHLFFNVRVIWGNGTCSIVSSLFSDYLTQAKHTHFSAAVPWVPSVPLKDELGIVAFQPPGCCGWAVLPSEPYLEASHVCTAASNTELKFWSILVQFWRCLDFWTPLCSDYRAHAFGNLNCCRGYRSLRKEGRPFHNGDGE